MSEGTKMVLQDRGYTSPIWYPPRPAAADEFRAIDQPKETVSHKGGLSS